MEYSEHVSTEILWSRWTMRAWFVVCSLVFAVFCADVGRAETIRSVLSAIDTQGRVVELGDEVEGSLSADDLISVRGDPIQAWVLNVPIGSIVQVDLRSEEFDAFLYIVGPGLDGGIRDDDGGDRYNSRICFIVEGRGEYRAIVSSVDEDLGAFVISAKSVNGTCSDTNEVTDLWLISASGRSLVVGDDIHGSLTAMDERLYGVLPVQAWAVQGLAGHPFSVDLLSEDFDGMLILLGPGIEGRELIDDNGAGGCNARLSLNFPETGEYKLVVSTLGTDTGSYRLVASERSGPVSPEPCPLEDSLSEIPAEGDVNVEQSTLGVIRGNERPFRGRPVQRWHFRGTDGENVALEITSDQFDPFIYFEGPGFPIPLSDDDSAGNDDSLICVSIPETGTYRVFVGAYDTADTGAQYILRATVRDADSICDEYHRSQASILVDLKERLIDVPYIHAGEVKDGFLKDSIVHPESNRPIDIWSLRAEAETLLYVDVVTDAFDAYLYALVDDSVVLTVNDHGENSNVRMELVAPNSGAVTLFVSSNVPHSSGDYILRVSTNPQPPLEQSLYSDYQQNYNRIGDSSEIYGIGGFATELLFGSEIHGIIDEDDSMITRGFAEAFSYDGSSGEDVAFELVSDEFDSYLYLAGPGIEGVFYDDDGAGGSDARIEVTIPQDGRYTVVVSTWSQGSTGRFRLRTFRIIRE